MNVRPKPDIEPTLGDTEVLEQPTSVEPAERATPFDDGKVDGLFFPGGGRQAALEQLTHLLRYGPSLLVLYGDQGVGKHYLVDHVIANLDPDLFDVAMVQAEVLMSPQQILSGLSGPWRSRNAFTLDSLQEQLIDCASLADNESRVLVLVVRQSQFLDEASVQIVSRMLASGAGLPIKVLLVMDVSDPAELEAFDALYDQVPDLFQLELAPFTQQETRDYLAYRMRTGGMGQVRFSEEQIERIFNMSLGNAARINEVAAALLKAAISRKQAQVDTSRIPWMHIGALGLVAILLLVLLFTRSETGGDAAPDQAAQLAGLSSEEKTAGPSEEPLSRPDDVPQQVVRLDKQQEATKPAPEPIVEQPVPPTETVEPVVSVAPEVVAPKPELKKPIEETPKPVSKPKVDSRTAWILAQPADHYAIQLLGAREKATVDKFLASYPSVQKLTYYEAKRNGAPWYVVVQASFPSYDAAKAAVDKLPQKLQKQGPWIRKIEAIQKDLKN
ncbi:MAG: hypothetical protein D9N11_16260 [Ketobacter sp.]|nr:MAG: hypothetical protein D9N11_16260 [Ketobacter sp.]